MFHRIPYDRAASPHRVTFAPFFHPSIGITETQTLQTTRKPEKYLVKKVCELTTVG